MYGTVARMKLKPGAASQMQAHMKEYESLNIHGLVGTYVFQMDSDQDEIYMVAAFESKAAYEANANDPAQHGRFTKMMELLTAEPEWHDGEIVYNMA